MLNVNGTRVRTSMIASVGLVAAALAAAARAEVPPTASCPADGATIRCGQLVQCSLDPAGDTDRFRFAVPAGARIGLSVGDTSFRQGNPCWRLYNPAGRRIASGCTGQTRLGPLQSGTHRIVLYWASGVWDRTGSYGLSLQGLSAPYHCGLPISFGITRNDSIDAAGDTDSFRVIGRRGQNLLISILDVNSRAGSPCWALYDPQATLITESCGTAETGPLVRSGLHTVVTWWAGMAFVASGPYALTVNNVGP